MPGAREDIESTFSNLKLTRGKLKSTDEDQNLFSLTAYMLLWMSRARTAYYESVAANPAQAIPWGVISRVTHRGAELVTLSG